MDTKMRWDTEEFYARLTPEDRARVEAVAAAFKSSRLEVRVTNDTQLALPQEIWAKNPTYDLIGLTVTPSEGMTVGDVRHSVADAVREFQGQEVEAPIDYKFLSSLTINPLHFNPMSNKEKSKRFDGFMSTYKSRPFRAPATPPEPLKHIKPPRKEYIFSENPPPADDTILHELMEESAFFSENKPEVVRDKHYRIGTIGETPIEVRVSYKPIDALSKLLEVGL